MTTAQISQHSRRLENVQRRAGINVNLPTSDPPFDTSDSTQNMVQLLPVNADICGPTNTDAFLYKELDEGNKGYINGGDIYRVFSQWCDDFSAAELEELLERATQGRTYITKGDFEFMLAHLPSE